MPCNKTQYYKSRELNFGSFDKTNQNLLLLAKRLKGVVKYIIN